MKTAFASVLFCLGVLGPALLAQDIDRAHPKPRADAWVPVLTLVLGDRLASVEVRGGEERFLVAAIVSLRPDLAHPFTGLPPLLADAVVLGIGKADGGRWALAMPMGQPIPAEVSFYAQAVALGSGGGVAVSDIAKARR